VIGNFVIEIEPAEPAIGKVQFDFLAQFALGADAVAVTYNEHSQHELGINRRTTDLAVEALQLAAKTSQ